MADCLYIPGHPVAVCSMPRATEIPTLASEFDAALVLAEEDELRGNYDLSEWGRHGVEYLHHPIPDFSSPDLLELHGLARWVASRVSQGKRVLIHCLGGSGRSGTVAAAYLIASGMVFEDAVEAARSARVGAIETNSQMAILEAYDLLLRSLPEPKLSSVVCHGRKYNFGRGRKHAAKVAQLAMKLWKLTSRELGVKPEMPPAPLTAGSILHDIGVCAAGEDRHHESSYREILESDELRSALGEVDLTLTALVALFHRKKGDPRSDERVPDDWMDLVAKMAAVVRMADALDRTLCQLVDGVGLDCRGGECVLTVYYSKREPEVELAKAREKSRLFEEVFGVRLSFRSAYKPRADRWA